MYYCKKKKKNKAQFSNVEHAFFYIAHFIFRYINRLSHHELFRSPDCKQHPRCPPIYHKQSAYFFRHVRSHKILHEVCRVRSNWNLKKKKKRKRREIGRAQNEQFLWKVCKNNYFILYISFLFITIVFFFFH